MLLRKVPLRDEAGSIVKWYGSATDIEDRKRAEDELRKQKELFQKIFENMPLTISFIGQDGHIELVNPEWERTLGWTLKEIRKQNLDLFAEFYPDPQYRQWVLDSIARSTGEWIDRKVRVRDGRVIDLAIGVAHLSDGTSVAIGQDITARKRAEQSLLLFRMLIDQSNDAIEVIDPENASLHRYQWKSLLRPGFRFKILDQESRRIWPTASSNHSLPRKRKASGWGSRSASP